MPEELENCVKAVMAKGKSKDSAYAICNAARKGKALQGEDLTIIKLAGSFFPEQRAQIEKDWAKFDQERESGGENRHKYNEDWKTGRRTAFGPESSAEKKERLARERKKRLKQKADSTKKSYGSHTSFVRIEKRDDEQQLVEGFASSEDIDDQGGVWQGQRYEGDVVSSAAIQKALPEYMEWGNLREMHDEHSAVGTVLRAEVIKGNVQTEDGKILHNPFRILAKISDPETWRKVKDGVLKGFSIKADVFELEVTKMFGKVVRLIKDLRFIEISLVDRPAHPGARVTLWKGASMNKPSAVVMKAAGHEAAVKALQELRDAAEMEGDLEKANQYSDAISLVMQAEGAPTEVVAEDMDEASSEHEALGKEPVGEVEAGSEAEMPYDEGADKDKEAVKEGDLDSLMSEGEETPREQPGEESEETPEEDKKEKEKEAALQPSSKTVITKQVVMDQVSKAKIVTLEKNVASLASDIARIVKSLEDLSNLVDVLKDRPVLRELPIPAPAGDGVGQSIEVMKALMDQEKDPAVREAISHRITEMEIRSTPAQYIGFSR